MFNFINHVVLFSLAFPTSVAARLPLIPSPPPRAVKVPLDVRLSVDPKKNPLDLDAVEIEIRTVGGEVIEVRTNTTCGAAVFLDFEVRNKDGKRLSALYFVSTFSTPLAQASVSATISKKAWSMTQPALFGVPDELLKAGTYKCRARYCYGIHEGDSDWVEVTLTEQQIRDHRKKQEDRNQ